MEGEHRVLVALGAHLGGPLAQQGLHPLRR